MSQVKTYDIVGFGTVLANRACDVTYDVVYDVVGFLRVTSVLYDVVRQIRCRRLKHTMYEYDVYIRVLCDKEWCYILPGAAAGAVSRTWPGPCRPQFSSLLILSPAGWSVLRCDSPDALFLVLAYEAAPGPDSSCPSQTGQSQPEPDSPTSAILYTWCMAVHTST